LVVESYFYFSFFPCDLVAEMVLLVLNLPVSFRAREMFGGICVWNCETAMCQRVSAPLEKISGMGHATPSCSKIGAKGKA
jgi:hypothetical protein